MRVFCPAHQKGFLTPRQSPIKCENRGHILGELNFAGEAKIPVEMQWQYCCNCEHFCPIDVDQNGLERCPVCTRRSSILYLCDRCYTISFESNTPLQTKNFTLTADGAPQPSCPGCLQATSADLREHPCDELGISLTTALKSCPICKERLDIGPLFPASVAHYLKKTRAASKLNVTFDYESELFVPVEDGEFVLVNTGNEAVQTIVLPRVESFTSRRDFYELYQDYYHCPAPAAGEVHIIQPAMVVPTVAGWKLLATGMLEVLGDRSQPKGSVTADHQQFTFTREEPRLSILEVKEESPTTPCTNCGASVESKYHFCWKCGKPMTSKNESSVMNREKSRTIAPSAAIVTDDEDLTLQHQGLSGAPLLFSWALTKDPAGPGSSKGSVLKLIAVAVVGLVVGSLGLFALTHSAASMDSAPTAQAVLPTGQSDPKASTSQTIKGEVPTETTAQRRSAASPEDDELKTLREKRITATTSDRSAILQVFAKAERRYPNDYRFPYERAKLAVNGPRGSLYDNAFHALSAAAEKAINTGKANEMLDALEADKTGDFRNLYRRHEWSELVKTLKKKDTSRLSANAQF